MPGDDRRAPAPSLLSQVLLLMVSCFFRWNSDFFLNDRQEFRRACIDKEGKKYRTKTVIKKRTKLIYFSNKCCSNDLIEFFWLLLHTKVWPLPLS
jgi:hypothetical protein